MANRRLTMRKIEAFHRLPHEGGRSNREIAQVVRSSPTTVGDYLRRARLAGIGWPLPVGMTEPDLEAALFPVPVHAKDSYNRFALKAAQRIRSGRRGTEVHRTPGHSGIQPG